MRHAMFAAVLLLGSRAWANSYWSPLLESLSVKIAGADSVSVEGSKLVLVFKQRTLFDANRHAFVRGDETETRRLTPELENDVREILARLPPWRLSASGFDVIAVPVRFRIEQGKPLVVTFGFRNRTAKTLMVPVLFRGGVSYSVTATDVRGEIVIDRPPREDPPPAANPLAEWLNTVNHYAHIEPGLTNFFLIGPPLAFATPGCYSIVVTVHRLNGTVAAAAPFEIYVTPSTASPAAPPSVSGSAP